MSLVIDSLARFAMTDWRVWVVRLGHFHSGVCGRSILGETGTRGKTRSICATGVQYREPRPWSGSCGAQHDDRPHRSHHPS